MVPVTMGRSALVVARVQIWGLAMSTRDRTLFKATIQSLNWIFWLASIALWLWIVIRSGIWSAGVASDIFWVNFLSFLAAGLGTLATTHFLASALPLLLGVMAITAENVKAGWFWLTLYIAASVVIGFVAGLIKLVVFLSSRHSGRSTATLDVIE